MASDITDRKRLEESLRLADRRKDEFLATLAHELRNPLAPIRNAIHLLKAADVADGKVRAARDIIDRQVQHMVRLVDDLLEVSRITLGQVTLRPETVASPQRPRRRVGGGGPGDRGSDSRAVCRATRGRVASRW